MTGGRPDPLSDVLRSVRLSGGLFLDARFTAPWCIRARIGLEDCTPFLPRLVQVIGYHVVLEGRMHIALDGEQAVEAKAGEIVLLPRNDVHIMSSGHGIAAVNTTDLIRRSPEGGLLQIRHGGGREPMSMVCGFLGTEDSFNPLLAALPRILTLDIVGATSRDWIETSVRFAAEELIRGRLASSSVMTRLSEVLLVEAVREYASGIESKVEGWLRGLTDQRIGRALACIHADVATPWTAEMLAAEAALSRSTFVERFTELVGMPPIRYLTVWRLEIAKRLLVESRNSVAEIAHSVGYESEEGFRRAFRREFHTTPAEWRNGAPTT